MDSRNLARTGAFAFVGIAVTLMAVQFSDRERREEPLAVAQVAPLPDPRRAALRACRDMGEAASRDPSCLNLWSENRDRFLGQVTERPAIADHPEPVG